MRNADEYQFDDPYDPRLRARRRLWLKAKCALVLILMLVLVMCLIGVPHLQGNFKTHYRRDGFTPARDKISASYLGPTGWRTYDAAYTDYEGLPVVLFVPVDEVFALSWNYPFLSAQGK